MRQLVAAHYIRLNSDRPLTAEQFNEIGRRSASPIQVQAMAALEKIDPEDAATVKFFRDATSGDNGLLAVTFLVKWAGDKEDRRKTVYPYIKLGVTQKANQNTVKFIEWAAEYGALSKDVLPAMKALKLNENRAVRDSASNATERIEAAVKP